MEEKPKTHGGARDGAGRKTEDGAAGLVICSYRLTPEQKEFAQRQGGSVFIRFLIDQAIAATKK